MSKRLDKQPGKVRTYETFLGMRVPFSGRTLQPGEDGIIVGDRLSAVSVSVRNDGVLVEKPIFPAGEEQLTLLPSDGTHITRDTYTFPPRKRHYFRRS